MILIIELKSYKLELGHLTVIENSMAYFTELRVTTDYLK